jgi:surface antigen
MIGIAEDDLRAEFFERFVAQAFYRALRAHGHEHWRFDGSVRCGQSSAARTTTVGLQNFKRKGHSFSVSGENPRSGHL